LTLFRVSVATAEHLVLECGRLYNGSSCVRIFLVVIVYVVADPTAGSPSVRHVALADHGQLRAMSGLGLGQVHLLVDAMMQGNMDNTIEWYKKNLGMKLLRYRDIPEGKYRYGVFRHATLRLRVPKNTTSRTLAWLTYTAFYV
jgi:4-hydroxyphenylpyruvate dioxygenase-like putative hemolysin